ncbi:hypothetical protein AYI70_g5777 [Smittium culicis]|uniref:Carbohydrate-binding module family 19 domain-containing protein n=1 Tax=Smittium culicis TaxID=133412 RepID=A0A1R1XSX5_9FUNG|nr:hypothetical protein AYI70_g7295 [Smittium culicis]OMJ17731.1 hypothetical protein AYI70_g5777 [Smittium culicis]
MYFNMKKSITSAVFVGTAITFMALSSMSLVGSAPTNAGLFGTNNYAVQPVYNNNGNYQAWNGKNENENNNYATGGYNGWNNNNNNGAYNTWNNEYDNGAYNKWENKGHGDYDRDHHREGGWCREGSYACVGFNNPTFLQCNHGRFVKMPCGPGTVCVRNGFESITCGYPTYLY